MRLALLDLPGLLDFPGLPDFGCDFKPSPLVAALKYDHLRYLYRLLSASSASL